MHWVYLVTTEDRPRVQSRVLHVFDNQRISVELFVSVRLGNRVQMRVAGDTGACDGMRLKALLFDVEDVRAIHAIRPEEESLEAASIFHASCPPSEQAGLRDILHALGATVTIVSPSQITFKAWHRVVELEDAFQDLSFRWPIDRCPGACEKCA